MSIDTLKRALLFVVLCLAQVLVLNRIHLFGYATPLLYVMMVLGFPRSYPRWAALLWSFALGFLIDVFSNTPGVASASLTLLALVQSYFFPLFVNQDEEGNIVPSMAIIGTGKYVFYAFVLVLLYCIVFFTLEMFCFFNWFYWLECVGGSTLLTLVLILTFESIKAK